MSNQALQLLKELIFDDDFVQLQSLSTEEINLMDILKVSHRELPHSNFLSWLFNPYENHRLGDYALKEFIKLYYKENQFQDLGKKSGLSVFDFVQMDFSDLIIKREYKNIDLVFLSKKSELCIVIENKIKSEERPGQLTRYRNIIEKEYPDTDFKHKIYIYLSLEEQNVSEEEQEHYTQLTYSHIIKLLAQTLSNKHLSISEEVKFIFEQYIRTLKSMTQENEVIESLVRTLYLKYKAGFDLVFKYNTNHKILIGNYLSDLIKNEPSIKPFQSNNTFIRFQPNYFYNNFDKLKSSGLIEPNVTIEDSRLFLFEFKIRRNKVIFCFKIGKSEQKYREKLYKIYGRDTKLFNKVIKRSGEMSPEWHQAFQKQILKPSEIEQYEEDGNLENLQEIITKRFNELIKDDVKKIIDFIDKEASNTK